MSDTKHVAEWELSGYRSSAKLFLYSEIEMLLHEEIQLRGRATKAVEVYL